MLNINCNITQNSHLLISIKQEAYSFQNMVGEMVRGFMILELFFVSQIESILFTYEVKWE